MARLTPVIENITEVCLTQPPKKPLSLISSSALLSSYHFGPSSSPSPLPSSILGPPPSSSALQAPTPPAIPTPDLGVPTSVSTDVVPPRAAPPLPTSLSTPASIIPEHSPSPPTYSSVTANGPTTPSPVESWANRLKSSVRNLRKMTEPTYLDDGTPLVKAPASILLKASETWKDYIVAHFHGNPPPPAKIFIDLNPIWGKFGKITVRCFSNGTCLIHIPSLNTRKWVLEVGFWQAGNCSFTVSEWSPSSQLQSIRLETAPLWVIIKEIPPELYSLDGIGIIASGIGYPLHTERSRLNPLQIGEAKVKVVIDLKKPLPDSVQVQDDHGNFVKVKVSYPRLPPKCSRCGEFGHSLPRCPLPAKKGTPVPLPSPSLPAQQAEMTDPRALISVSSPPLPVSPPVPVAVSGSVSPLVQNPEPSERPQEVPDPSDSAMLQSPLLLNDSSPALPSPTIPVIIVEEGSISPIHSTEASLPVGLHTVSDEVQAQANDQTIAQDSDEDIIASAQKILRLRVDAADPITSPSSSAKKAARKKRSKAKSSQSKQKKKKKSSSPGKGKSH